MKPLKDYSFVRGFNYTQSSSRNDAGFWDGYDHDVVDRDMGYAQRLNLNSARVFLTYSSYIKDKEKFLANVKDFVQTAWKHGITTNPIVYFGMRFLPEDLNNRKWGEIPKTLLDPSCWVLGEKYFDDLYEAIGNEPGLLFWDISNEPGYRIRESNTVWYDEEPARMREGVEEPDFEYLRYRQNLVWEFIRHFCKYVKKRDPVNAIGVGNTFIYETEASGTAELVDIIVFHDYFETRKRVREVYDYAMELSRKYNKPVINNETCCLCRANPYDMVLELISEYPFGWYVFELMIGTDMWNRVHGICYPDGTVRDPSIVSALFGFFRNRTDSDIYPDINQEHHADMALELARKALAHDNTGFTGHLDNAIPDLLEAAEYMANLLEAGQHVPMDIPPTARINHYRAMENPDVFEIRRFVADLANTLKRVCDIV